MAKTSAANPPKQQIARDLDAAAVGASDQPRSTRSVRGGRRIEGAGGRQEEKKRTSVVVVEEADLLDAGGREVHVHGEDPDILAVLHLEIPAPAPAPAPRGELDSLLPGALEACVT
jgi:hypothetical protein